MNRAIVILGVGTLAAFGMFAYGLWGPHYATEPVQAPFSLSKSETQEFPFKVGRSTTYFVEVHLREALPENEMERILGDFVAGGGGALDIAWSITNKGVVVANGSNKQYGYSPIWGGGYRGLVVGTFEAQRSRPYVLHLTSRNGESLWDRCDPMVEVGLHPAQLEYLLGYWFLGGALLLIFGSAFLSLVGVKAYRWARNRTAHGAGGRHHTMP